MLHLFLAFFLTTTLFASSKVVEDKNDLTILTPSLKERKTLKIKLENGLQAYLISDPGATESGAAMAVNVGSFSDPKEYPGLAHYVEHMLFMGTEKFPDEKEYHRYLDEHGGTHNAFTCPDRTLFMFAINHDGFLGAVERFSEFFVSPLFQVSCLQRECQAVDQEFSKNVTLDSWRTLHVHKELGCETHPFHTFSIGNQSTLGKISRDEVVSWYNSHYSANLMHLIVYSPLPLDKLQNLVETGFSKVKNTEQMKQESFSSPLLSKNVSGKLIVIEPHQKIQKLELSWEIPEAIAKNHEVRSEMIVGYILGHEGEKTLSHLLKKEGLCTSVSASTHRMGPSTALFNLKFDLTTLGVKNYERIIELAFETLRLYEQSSVPQYLFDEMVQMEKISYSYQQREDVFEFITKVGYLLPDEPLETFPKFSLIPAKFDPKKATELLSTFKPENCCYTLIAPKELTRIKSTHKERWMGAEYSLIDIEEKKIAKWINVPLKSALSLPKPNSFIPTNLSLVQELTALGASLPVLPEVKTLVSDHNKRVVFATDDRFFVPEIYWSFTFKTPAISDDQLESKVLADLYCHAVKERLNTLCYEAELAGLEYALTPAHNGINLTIKGYSEKAKNLLGSILDAFAHRPDAAEFALYKEEFERSYRNAANKTAVAEGYELLLSVLYKDYAGNSVKQEAIASISYENFLHFASTLFKENFLEATLFGNLTASQASELVDQLEKKIPSSGYPPEKHYKVELGTFGSEKDPLLLVKKSKLPTNALILTLDCNPFSFKREAALNVLSKAIEEPFFSELRTRQQTAYLVTNFADEKEEHLYLLFLIQSASHDPRDLLSRFELFFETSLQNFEENIVSNERFENIRSSLIYSLAHSAENIAGTGSLLHRLGFEYDAHFERINEKIEALKALSFEEFTAYAHEILGTKNHKRLAVCVQGDVPSEGSLFYKRLPNAKKLRKSLSYHSLNRPLNRR
jgi:insulysin